MADIAEQSNENLNSQRAKFDEYRKWMSQQKQTLETTGQGTSEIARRLEQQSNHSTSQNNSNYENMSSYMRRHEKGKHAASSPSRHLEAHHGRYSPKNSMNPGNSVNPHHQQFNNMNMNMSNNDGSSPYRSPNGEKPPWINTKVGSTNTKSAIPPEQLAKFTPPPPSDDGGYNNDPLNVFSRSTLWQKRKHQKLSEARELKEQVMDMECTFAPSTHTDLFFSHSRERSREPSVLSGQKEAFGGFKVTGVQEFVERQNKARTEVEFKEQRLKTKPQFAWRNETTVPEPFDLGRRRDHRIKALKQPFTAAPGTVQQAMRGAPIASSSNVFAPIEGVVPRGVFSGVTAADIVDPMTLRTGGASPSALDRN